jgi:hypothetical protein
MVDPFFNDTIQIGPEGFRSADVKNERGFDHMLIEESVHHAQFYGSTPGKLGWVSFRVMAFYWNVILGKDTYENDPAEQYAKAMADYFVKKIAEKQKAY